MADKPPILLPERKISGSVTGSFSPSGLTVEGENTRLAVDDTAWKQCPPTNLSGRNAIRVQNPPDSAFSVFIRHKTSALPAGPSTTPGTAAADEIIPGDTYFVDITDSINLFVRCASGESATVNIAELA